MSDENSDTLEDFTKYCRAHPGERFWQALRNWSGAHFIFAANAKFDPHEGIVPTPPQDTFSWKGRQP